MKWLIILTCFTYISTKAQNLANVSANAIALGNQEAVVLGYSAMQTNIAELGFLEHSRIGFSAQNKYQISELIISQATYEHKLKNTGIGFGYKQLSLYSYSEQEYALAFGMQLAKNLSVASRVRLVNQRLSDGNLNQLALLPDLGFLYKLSPKITIGTSLANFTGNKQDQRNIATSYRVGLSYAPHAKLTFYGEFQNSSLLRNQLALGICYLFSSEFSVRYGFNTGNKLNAFGFGWQKNHFNTAFAFSHDSKLGFSPVLSLSYLLFAKGKK